MTEANGIFLRGLLVFLGGGLGANVRYWLGLWISARTNAAFPWATFIINVSGSFIIGLAMGYLISLPSTHWWRVFFVVGVLGGYTTFSTFSYETVSLIRDRSYLYAAGNMLGSCLVGFIACWLGLVLTNAFSRG